MTVNSFYLCSAIKVVHKLYLCHKVSKDNRPDLYAAYGPLYPIYLLFYFLDLPKACVLFV